MALHTTASLQHYQYLFTIKTDNVVTKMEAHVFALSDEEADLLFNQKCPNVWARLDIVKKGMGRVWMISGKKFNSNRSYVAHVGPYVEPADSGAPFTAFVSMYRSNLMEMPLPKLRAKVFKHNAGRMPTREQIEIIADETGEWPATVQYWATREFRAHCFNRAVEQYGRGRIMKIVRNEDNFDACEHGRCDDDLWQSVRDALPNFGIVRHYEMTVGELMFFHDMNTGCRTDREFYTGEISILDFPKRVLKHLCNIDTRFAELAAKEHAEKSL